MIKNLKNTSCVCMIIFIILMLQVQRLDAWLELIRVSEDGRHFIRVESGGTTIELKDKRRALSRDYYDAVVKEMRPLLDASLKEKGKKNEMLSTPG